MKTTSQPIHHLSTERLRNESVSSSPSERNPTKIKPTVHKSVKSLIERQDIEMIDDYKYFSNSLNCLDVSKI